MVTDEYTLIMPEKSIKRSDENTWIDNIGKTCGLIIIWKTYENG